MGELLDLAIYNPAQLSNEDFVRGFVARRDVLEKILARLGQMPPNGLAEHRLILGQRGMGKTSLLRRIAIGVNRKPTLKKNFLPLMFREEQYNVHNLHVLWCNCLDGLGDLFEAEGRSDLADKVDRDVQALDNRTDDDEGSAALAVFRQWTKSEGKRPLLLLDNIDLILNGLADKQWSLRRVLQERGGIVVFGATSAFLESTVDPKAPFYEFFKVDVLQKLGREEFVSCLKKLAGERGDPGKRVIGILNSDPARLLVLYDLTGGNPRTLAMIYLILEMLDDGDFMRDLERLLDQATPLYKARVEELSPQARVVFDAIALNWDPVIAADIAAAAGLDVGKVSAQVNRLEQDGTIEKTTLSSTSRVGFQLGERFFNIWYLMRHAPRRQRNRLRWLTGFLRSFYTPQQLTETACGMMRKQGKDRLTSGMYCLALSDAMEDTDMKRALRIEARRNLEMAGDGGGDVVEVKEIEKPETAREWVMHGRYLSEVIKAYDRAEEAYRKAIELDPRDASAWNNLGILLVKHLGRMEEAESAFRKAIELDPKDYLAWSNLGVLLYNHSRFEEAESVYRKAIELEPKYVDAWYNHGVLLVDQNRTEEAESAYRKAIELEPKYARAWNGLGVLLYNLNRSEEAESAFRQAIELGTKYADVWYNHGVLLVDQNRTEEAESAFRKAIELEPKYARAWNGFGVLLVKHLGRPEEAESAFRKAIELDSKHASAWYNLGVLLNDHGRPEEAEFAFRKAIELNPKYVPAWNNLGGLLYNFNRFEESESAFRKAIELDPKHASAWNNLGVLLGDHDRFEEAESAYRKAIELDPKYSNAWGGLGILLAKHLGRPEEAESAYRKALDLDPKNASAWTNLGNLYADYFNRPTDAETVYQKALEINPEDPIIIANLAYLLLPQENRQNDAEPVYQKAIKLLPSHGAGLLQAFSAFVNDNFGDAATKLAAVLDQGHPELFSTYEDDLFRVFRFAGERGYGEKLLAWLNEAGYKDRYWPLWTAYDAYLHGEKLLQDVNPEVRGAAEKILAGIAIKRKPEAVIPSLSSMKKKRK